MTVDEMQAALSKLRATRALGAREVRYSDGRSTTFGTDAELVAAIADLESRIAAASGRRIHTIVMSSSKGL